MNDIAHDIADAILGALGRREGFHAWWDDIEPDIQDEIRDSIASRLREAMRQQLELARGEQGFENEQVRQMRRTGFCSCCGAVEPEAAR